jgi:hypothetical protein
MMLRQVFAKMPFAKRVSAIAQGLQRVGDGRFRGGKTGVRFALDVLFHAKALLVAPRHQTSPRGTTHRPAHISAAEPHAARRQRIQVRRQRGKIAVDAPALKADVSVARVVGEDDEDVGSSMDFASPTKGAGQCEQCDYQLSVHFRKLDPFVSFRRLFCLLEAPPFSVTLNDDNGCRFVTESREISPRAWCNGFLMSFV